MQQNRNNNRNHNVAPRGVPFVMGGNNGQGQNAAGNVQPGQTRRWINKIPTTLTISVKMGAQGLSYAENYFSVLGDKFKYEPKDYHDHAWLAFVRKHTNHLMWSHYLANYTIVSIGDHSRTQTTIDQSLAGQTAYSDRVHGMCPIVDERDKNRHDDWERQWKVLGIEPVNVCLHRATRAGLCECVTTQYARNHGFPDLRFKYEAITTIDSIYYDGVFESICVELLKNRTEGRNVPVYAAFHDLLSAYRDQKFTTFDNEAEITFEERSIYTEGQTTDTNVLLVSMEVNGNPDAYTHRVVNRPMYKNKPAMTWTLPLADGWFVLFEVKNTMNVGSHDYLLTKISLTKGKLSDKTPCVDSFFFKTRQMQSGRLIEVVSFKKEKPIDATVQHMIQVFSEKSGSLSYDPTARTVTAKLAQTRMRKIFSRLYPYKKQISYTAPVELVEKLALDYQKATTPNALKLRIDAARKEFKVEHPGLMMQQVFENASIIGYTYMSYSTGRVLGDYNENLYVQSVKEQLNGTIYANTSLYRHNLKQSWLTYLIVFLIFALIWEGYRLFDRYLIGQFGVSAQNYELEDGEQWYMVWAFSLVMTCIYAVLTGKDQLPNIPKEPDPMVLYTTPVTIGDRLRPDKTQGFVKLKIKVNDKLYALQLNQTDRQLIDDFEHRAPKPVAHRCGPLMRGVNTFKTPTIKGGPAAAWSALLRQFSMKLRPHPVIAGKFCDFLGRRMKKFLNAATSVEEPDTLVQWLYKYPEYYRADIVKALDQFDPNARPDFRARELFPKREKNISDVEHSEKDTEANTVKERCISALQYVEKDGTVNHSLKICMYILHNIAKLAKKHFPGYASGESFETLALRIKEMDERFPNGKLLESDGSGFDQTQRRQYDNVILESVLTYMPDEWFQIGEHAASDVKNWFRWVFEQTQDIDVSLNNGSVKVTFGGINTDQITGIARQEAEKEARGSTRKSGDPWTSVWNTLLSLNYYQFTAYLAGIKSDEICYAGVGDDILIKMEAKKADAFEDMMNKLFATSNEDREFGLGQIVKEKKWSDDIEKVSFLSCKFVKDPLSDQYIVIRRLERAVQSCPWTMKLVNTSDEHFHQHRAELAYLQGLSMMQWAKDFPVFDEYARTLLRIGKPISVDRAAKLRLIDNYHYTALKEMEDQSELQFPDDPIRRMMFYRYLQREYGTTWQETLDAIQQVRRADIDTTIISSFFDTIAG